MVRDWRDMAPGLVFCDTGFLCSAVFSVTPDQAAYSPTPPLEGDSLEVDKEKTGETLTARFGLCH